MKKCLLIATILLCTLFVTSNAIIADTAVDGGKTVVPPSERAIAQDLAADGPTETLGIEASTVLGSMSLAGEFAGTEGHMLRVREVTVLPGGQVAVHQHTSRPGAAYVLEGELVEHRNDVDGPLVRHVGDVALEKTGTIHWWKNESSEKAKVLVVDIVPNEAK